jgi:F-type H+-transporting ATPase subunit b
MINLDQSVIYQVVLFLVLWLILSKVLFQPYLRLLEEREQKTTGAEHDSAELELEGAQLKARYEEKVAAAQAAGYAAKEAIVQEARQQREKILGAAREEAATTLNRLRQDVTTAMANERQLAAAEVSILASDMASKVLGRKVA